jgi:HAD superfamily hydrolase (TIGR01509 family)
MNSEIEAIIFDRDGVLTYFDTFAVEQRIAPLLPFSIYELVSRWQTWGNEYGFPGTLEEEDEFFQSFWGHIGAEFELSSSVQESLYSIDYTDFVIAYPDAKAALMTARSQGLAVGVLSNFSLASLNASLVAAGLSEFVDVACAATAIGAYKPSPESYHTVIDALGVEPSTCLFFDDEPLCVQGASAVGAHAYLVDRSQTAHNLAVDVVCDLTAIGSILTNLSVDSPSESWKR